MKIHSLTNYNSKYKNSFGLKIVKDKEYIDLVNYLKSHSIANETEVKDLFNKVENLAFNNDNKHSTSIAFGPIQNLVWRNEHGKSDLDSNSRIFIKGINYHLWDSNISLKGPVKMRWLLYLTKTNVKEILSEIASDYAKYIYSK